MRGYAIVADEQWSSGNQSGAVESDDRGPHANDCPCTRAGSTTPAGRAGAGETPRHEAKQSSRGTPIPLPRHVGAVRATCAMRRMGKRSRPAAEGHSPQATQRLAGMGGAAAAGSGAEDGEGEAGARGRGVVFT